MFARYLGTETQCWASYHMRRTTLTLAVHGGLALLFPPLLWTLTDVRFRLAAAAAAPFWSLSALGWAWGKIACATLFLGGVGAGATAWSWTRRGFAGHPFAKLLAHHSPTGLWRRVVGAIEVEARASLETVHLRLGPTTVCWASLG